MSPVVCLFKSAQLPYKKQMVVAEFYLVAFQEFVPEKLSSSVAA